MSESAGTALPQLSSAGSTARPGLRLAGLWPWVAAAAVLVGAPFVFASGTALTMMSLMGIMIVFGLSYNMLLGQTGMLSFGHAVYYGLGGFFTVHAMNAVIASGLPVPAPLMPLVGGLAGLAFGFLFGSVSTRRGGTAFAMISLGLGELVSSSANILRSFFGGEEGITTNRTKLFRVFDISFGPQIQVYFLIAAWCLASAALIYGISRTPLGRMCNAVRENQERVQFVGYDPQVIRLAIFCLSGFFAGIAGGLAAINFEIVNSSYIGAGQSGIVLLAAFIGGIGHFVGPVIGAIVVTYLQVMLSDVTEVWQLYFGLLFVAIVLFAPGGIAGVLAAHGPILRARQLPRLLPAYLLAAIPAFAALAAAILAIELGVRLLTKGGEEMLVAGLHVDPASPLAWLATIALAALGGIGLWFAVPRIREAFDEAQRIARTRPA